MNMRTVREIEEAFREMGLTESSWGRLACYVEVENDRNLMAQVFIRIETTTTSLENKNDANLA
jgi:hypothetical protein